MTAKVGCERMVLVHDFVVPPDEPQRMLLKRNMSLQRSEEPTSVLAIILNYKTAEMAIACLRSLEQEIVGYPEAKVVLVDNASGDDSVQRFEAEIRDRGWSGWASVVALAGNGGFAAGNNAAIRPLLGTAAMPDYVLLLNSDTVVRPGAVSTLVQFMDARPDVGIAGSRLEDPDGCPQRSAFLFPNVWSELNDGIHLQIVERWVARSQLAPPVRYDAHRTDWVAGASFIMRRALLEQIGLLDEGYFMYYEEVDFCLRARRAGWQCWYVPESRVVHLVGQASRINNPDMKPKRRPAYWFESRQRFFRKNHGVMTTLFADALFLAGYAFYRLRRLVTLTPVREPPWFFWDFLRFSMNGLVASLSSKPDGRR